MWTEYLGLDPQPVRELATELTRWQETIHDALLDVVAAETLIGEGIGVRARLDHVSETTRLAARAMQLAVETTESFHISVDATWSTPTVGLVGADARSGRTGVSTQPRSEDLPTGVQPWGGPGPRALPPERSVSAESARLLALNDWVDPAAGALSGEMQAIETWRVDLRRGHPSRHIDASELVAHIRSATVSGRAPNPDAHEWLSVIFHSEIEDAQVANAALVLALRGFDTDVALQLETQDDLAAVYDQIAAQMNNGVAPGTEGLDADLFPIEYRHWHLHDQAIADAWGESSWQDVVGTDLIETSIERRDATALSGYGDASFEITAGGVSEFAALSSLSGYFSQTSSAWVGSSLAGGLGGTLFDDHVATVAQLLADDTAAAVAFFTELGAFGTALLPEHVAYSDRETATSTLSVFAQALGQASHFDIGFTGDELIEADISPGAQGYNIERFDVEPAAHVELLLLASGFDQQFLLDAAEASLVMRNVHAYWDRWDSFDWKSYDPRLIAIQAAIETGLSTELVMSLADGGQLDSLIDPDVDFASFADPGTTLNPYMHAVSKHPATVLIALAAANAAATDEIVDYLHTRGSYDDPSVDTFTRRDIHDERVVDGLSLMLLISAMRYVDPGESREKFLNSYHTVVQSGGGNELALVGSAALFGTTVQSSFAAGDNDPDLTNVLEFAASIEHIRRTEQGENAEAIDRANAALARNLSVAALLLGLTPGGLVLSASTLTIASNSLSALSLITPQTSLALEQSREALTEILRRPDLVEQQLVLAALRSGAIRDANGFVVYVEEVHPAWGGPTQFQVVTSTGTIMLSDGFTAAVPRDVAYFEREPFTGFVIQGDLGTVPFADLHDLSNEIVADLLRIENALHEAAGS